MLYFMNFVLLCISLFAGYAISTYIFGKETLTFELIIVIIVFNMLGYHFGYNDRRNIEK